MSIRKRESKKTISGYTYQVYFPYVDSMGVHRDYIKGGFKTKKEAQTHEALMRNEIATYGDLYLNVGKTFNDVFEEFMDVEGYKKYSKSTIQYYMHSYNKYVKIEFGHSKIAHMKYRDIQKYFNNLECGLSTAKNIKKVFNKTFSYALKNGCLKENPMVIVDKHVPDYDYSQFNYYSYAVALLIGWYTGMRVSETFGLEKKDIDFENNLIHIQRRLEYHGVKIYTL